MVVEVGKTYTTALGWNLKVMAVEMWFFGLLKRFKVKVYEIGSQEPDEFGYFSEGSIVHTIEKHKKQAGW